MADANQDDNSGDEDRHFEVYIVREDDGLSSVAGMHKIKDKLREHVCIKHLFLHLFPRNYHLMTSILLYGPPSVGKTLISKCMAAETNLIKKKIQNSDSIKDVTLVHYHSCDFFSSYNHGVRTVRDLFEFCRRHLPCVLILDELDAPCAIDGGHSQDSYERIQKEICESLRTMTSHGDIFTLIGITNHPTRITHGLRRKFTTRIYVDLPDFITRKEILRMDIQKLDPDCVTNITEDDLSELALATEGFTGGELCYGCRESMMENVRWIGNATHFKWIKEGSNAGKVMPCESEDPAAIQGTFDNFKDEELYIKPIEKNSLKNIFKKMIKLVEESDLEENRQFMNHFGNLDGVLPLMKLARDAIHGMIPLHNLSSVEDLPIPRRLKYYIICEESL